MSDYPKVSNDISSSSVDSLNTNSCSSKTSATTNETINSIKYQGKLTDKWDNFADNIGSGALVVT